MVLNKRPWAEVSGHGFDVLLRELGPADTIRFIKQFYMGSGDYTAERQNWLGDMTVDQIAAEIEAMHKQQQ
jgi:hypothetical protein